MAEYAGLEIRIGGNTTKLTNALKAPTKAAAELQRQIRQATRAMQFDPNDLKNIDTRIKITGDRMQSLQSKAQITKTAMQQLGDTMVKFHGKDRSVRDIANETQNLTLKAKQADERFNNMTGTLAKIYESWNRLSRDTGSDILTDKLSFTDADARRLMSGATSLRDFVTELREVQSLRADPLLGDGKPIISDADIEKLKQLKQLNFHDMFKRGLGLDDVLEEAERFGIVIEDSAIANVRELQKTFKGAQQDKEAFDKALKFEEMGTDLQRINSEAESLSQTMRKLDDTMSVRTTAEPFQELEAKIRSIDAALSNVDKDLERTGEAMRVDPGNIEVAARYFGDLQQKASLSEEKVALLREQMEWLGNDKGAAEAARDHQDLAKWVEESAEAARVARKEYSEQSATVANLNDQVKRLEQTIATVNGDSTLASYSDGVLEWQKQTDRLADAMKRLESAERNVADEQAKIDDLQRGFDNATKEAERYEKQLESLRGEYAELETSMEAMFANGEYDPSMDAYLGGLKTAIEQTEDAYVRASNAAGDFSDKIKVRMKDGLGAAQGKLEQQKVTVDELRESIAELEKTPDVRLFQHPTDEIEKLDGELAELRGELGKAMAEEERLASAYTAKKTENELAKTAQAAREVSQDADEASASLKKVMDEIDGKGGGIFNASTIKSLGMTLSATVTPALVGIGYKMVDASADVDSAYRDMRKTVQGTEEQFEHLRAAAIEFSRTHVTSADQILQIEAIGGELGVATEALETFAEVISNIDVATNLDTESAAEALGHLGNILHLTEEDYVGFSDALVRLGNNGASTETEIANIAERIGSMGSIVGMSGSDILAWSSTIASTGQRAEAAGTAISRTMSFMETAVAAAGGTLDTSFEAIDTAVQEGGDRLTVFANLAGTTAEDFAESWETNAEEMASNLKEQLEGAKDGLQIIADVAHMTADEFIKAWESDPTSVLEAFIKGLNDIETAGGSADSVLQSLGIKAVRQKQAIEGLMQTVGGLDDNLRMSEDAWNGVTDKWGVAGDAANEAAKKAEGFSGQIQIMKNMAQSFFSELGEGAVPWIKSFSGTLETMSRYFSSLSADTKKWVVGMGGIAALAGPFLSFGSTMSNVGSEFMDFVSKSTSGINLVKLSYKHYGEVVSGALDGTMSSMGKAKLLALDFGSSLLKGLAAGAVVAAIGVIATALMKLYDQYKDHVAATKGLSDALAGIGVAAESSVDSVEDTGRALVELWEDASAYESRLANLTRTIEDSNRQYGTYAGQMDYYADTIAKLGGKAELTEGEAQRLSAALVAINDACGTTYGLDEYGNIIDTQTGKIQDNTDTILANIDARKQQALIDYYSDDYAQAVGEWAEAQDKLNEARDRYNELTSDGGYERYLETLKETLGVNYNAADAEIQYANEVQRAKDAMYDYQVEAKHTGEAVSILEGKISSAEDELNKANQVVEDAAKAQEELDRRSDTVAGDVTGNMKRLSDSMAEMGGSDTGFNAIAKGLESISVSANELNGVDMGQLVSAYSDVDGSMQDVIKTLEDGGVVMSTWNSALEQAPGAAENMGLLTAAAFQAMYDSADSDINATMTLIAGLDAVKVDDKTFYIGDNGSITDEQGKVYDINKDIEDIPDQVITTYCGDNSDLLKKTMESKKDLKEVGKQKPTPKIGAKNMAGTVIDSVKKKLSTLDTSKATPDIKANDFASSTISSVSRKLSELNGRVSTVTVRTVEKRSKQATGGLNNRPVIPRHATGYIAKGPTLTNQGWIGEDGIEAVANWATGGVVVPLTNKKYMLPIADAIADGMAARNQTTERGQTVVYVTVSGVVGPDDTADAIARKLELLDL